jgi:hypothetical protein
VRVRACMSVIAACVTVTAAARARLFVGVCMRVHARVVVCTRVCASVCACVHVWGAPWAAQLELVSRLGSGCCAICCCWPNHRAPGTPQPPPPGAIVYHGPVSGAVPHFASLGFDCPPRKDLASFLQEVSTPAGQLAYASAVGGGPAGRAGFGGPSRVAGRGLLLRVREGPRWLAQLRGRPECPEQTPAWLQPVFRALLCGFDSTPGW